jgi:hypothetical protein
VLRAKLSPSIVHQNAPHRFGGCREEMLAATEVLRVIGIHEPNVRLVHQRRGLKSLTRLLVPQSRGGKLAKFIVHQRQKLFSGSRIARLDPRKDLRNVAHRRRRPVI